MVEKLRKQRERSLRWRFPIVVSYGCLIVFWLFMLNRAWTFPSDDPMIKLTVLVFLVPPAFGFIGILSHVIGDTVSNWNGKPEEDLLLRVLDELQKKDG